MTETTGVVSEVIQGLAAPAEIREALSRLTHDLTRAADRNLTSLILYGGLARSRYRPGKSDINLVIVLGDASAESLAKIAPILRAAWRAVRVEPFILRASDVQRLAELFPTKMLDIQTHRVVLCGEDPFAGATVSPQQIRLRIEQGLHNLALRLRRRFISIFDDPRSQALALADAAVGLKIELAGLLRLAGKEEPSESTTAAVLDAAAVAFDLDREALSIMAGLRRVESGLPTDLTGIYDRVLVTILRAAEIASRVE